MHDFFIGTLYIALIIFTVYLLFPDFAVRKLFKPVEIIPLSRAVLCEDCGNITELKTDTCRACGSLAIYHVRNRLSDAALIYKIEANKAYRGIGPALKRIAVQVPKRPL